MLLSSLAEMFHDINPVPTTRPLAYITKVYDTTAKLFDEVNLKGS